MCVAKSDFDLTYSDPKSFPPAPARTVLALGAEVFRRDPHQDPHRPDPDRLRDRAGWHLVLIVAEVSRFV